MFNMFNLFNSLVILVIWYFFTFFHFRQKAIKTQTLQCIIFVNILFHPTIVIYTILPVLIQQIIHLQSKYGRGIYCRGFYRKFPQGGLKKFSKLILKKFSTFWPTFEKILHIFSILGIPKVHLLTKIIAELKKKVLLLKGTNNLKKFPKSTCSIIILKKFSIFS